MQTKSTTIPSTLSSAVGGHAALDVLLIAGASMLIAIAAQIAMPIPFSPVPLTMQPLAVLLIGVTLGSTRGAAAAALYLLEGFSGMPVFAQGHGGALWLTAATAGYLWSYPAAAWVAGWFSERGWGSTAGRAIGGMMMALAVIYAGGWSWLTVITGPRNAWTVGVAPFVIADIIKVAFGAALLPQLQRLVISLRADA